VRLIYLFLLLLTPFLSADEEKKNLSQAIVLPAGSVHEGDYFAIGSSVEISGTVNGDVYVLAEQIVVDGTVNGDVLCSGGSITVSGKVMDNCRLVGGQILISGAVGKNVTAVAGNLQLMNSATLGENLVAVAGNADLAAKINGDATLVASNLRVASQIQGDLQGIVGEMRLTSKAFIGGDVDYRASQPALIDAGAVVRGGINHHPSFVHKLVKDTWVQRLLVGSKVVARLMNFFYTFVVGLILLKLFPKNLEAALHSLHHAPLKSLSYGIMLLVLLPLTALIFLMTILGVPFALTLIAANIIGFYTAKVYCIFWGSNWLFAKMGMRANHLPAFFLGVIVYFAIISIPFLGVVLSFLAMLFGLGAGVLAQAKRLPRKIT